MRWRLTDAITAESSLRIATVDGRADSVPSCAAARSSTSATIWSSCSTEISIDAAVCLMAAGSFRSRSTWLWPRIAFSGVRISWLISDRNRDFAALDDSASPIAAASRVWVRWFWISEDTKYPTKITEAAVAKAAMGGDPVSNRSLPGSHSSTAAGGNPLSRPKERSAARAVDTFRSAPVRRKTDPIWAKGLSVCQPK